MTADQLIVELFVNHWLATTLFFPPMTMMYAWVTGQMAWFLCSFGLGLLYGLLIKS